MSLALICFPSISRLSNIENNCLGTCKTEAQTPTVVSAILLRLLTKQENITGNSHIILEACHGTANTS